MWGGHLLLVLLEFGSQLLWVLRGVSWRENCRCFPPSRNSDKRKAGSQAVTPTLAWSARAHTHQPGESIRALGSAGHRDDSTFPCCPPLGPRTGEHRLLWSNVRLPRLTTPLPGPSDTMRGQVLFLDANALETGFPSHTFPGSRGGGEPRWVLTGICSQQTSRCPAPSPGVLTRVFPAAAPVQQEEEESQTQAQQSRFPQDWKSSRPAGCSPRPASTCVNTG